MGTLNLSGEGESSETDMKAERDGGDHYELEQGRRKKNKFLYDYKYKEVHECQWRGGKLN